jgi:microcystin-dependent protein
VPKCGCASDQCSCYIIAGDGTTVAGAGTASNPYVITQIPTQTGGSSGSGRFTGEITAYAGSVAPSGWLVCDGSAVSRTVYAALFAVVGVAYGAGDGSTTFNLPDVADRFPVGAGGKWPRGQQGGVTKITTAHLPAHTHTINHSHPAGQTTSDGLHDHQTNHNNVDGSSTSTFRTADATGRVVDANLTLTGGAHSHSVTVPALTNGVSGSTGAPTPSDYVPPYSALTFIIKT